MSTNNLIDFTDLKKQFKNLVKKLTATLLQTINHFFY